MSSLVVGPSPAGDSPPARPGATRRRGAGPGGAIAKGIGGGAGVTVRSDEPGAVLATMSTQEWNRVDGVATADAATVT